jgi:hypothetical protein
MPDGGPIGYAISGKDIIARGLGLIVQMAALGQKRATETCWPASLLCSNKRTFADDLSRSRFLLEGTSKPIFDVIAFG